MTTEKKKSVVAELSSTQVAARKFDLEKELVKYRLSLDAGTISVTGGYPALMKEIRNLSRVHAKFRAVSGGRK
jgi:hypothetical protein